MSSTENSDLNAAPMEEDPLSPGVDTEDEDYLKVDDDILIPRPAKTAAELDLSGPRLMITKIVNVNFKSYAGTTVIGPFHKSFSAIVGPNGSGKSNVIDSMLFVFGYRASKIRSKKISVLIHNSSEHPDCESCSVEVHFQRIIDKPGADYDVVPNSQFSISRTAFKDSSSYYQLSGKKVVFKEISKVLRADGVDLIHNRFLILQGEVEQIAMMKPKGQNEHDTGMLEFLEDIIGTVRYKEPLEKLFEKVNAVSEQRLEKWNRLVMIEREKATLKKPMEKAVEYLQIENAITRLEHQLYSYKRYNTSMEAEAEEKKVAELEKDLSELKAKMKSVTDDKEAKTAEMKEKGKVWDKIQQKKDECTAKFDKIRKIDETLHAELVGTNKRRKTNIATLKTENTKLEELEKIPNKNAKGIKECEDLIEKHVAEREKEEAALTALMAGLKQKTEPLLNERSKLEKQLLSLRKDIDQAQSTFDIAKSQFELYTSLEHTEKDKLTQLKETLQTTVETLDDRKKQLALLQKKIPASESSLQEAQQELGEARAQEQQLTAKLKKMRISFEEQKSSMQASRSRNKVLDSLMQQKREGKLPGIFGRLGDLGAIPGKYDVAISTACGPLDNIVVDTVQTALSCISFLRKNDIGRATFIALEKQQHFWPRCRETMHAPENVPRLYDLIKVEDERVLPAFYYGLQDTLVAENLDQATRIAYGKKRYRVVTLKGELIEISGTMSGGGNTVLRGRMGQKVVGNEPSAADVEKSQAELEQVFQECNRLRSKQQPLESQIQTLSTALTEMKITNEKFKIEVSTLKDQEPSLRKQLQIQEKKAAESVSDPKKLKQMEKAMHAAKKQLDKVLESSKSIESEVKRINDGIEEISGGQVKNQQKKITTLTNSIDKAKAEICRLQVAIKTAERNVQKAKQRIETLESDIQTCEERLRDIQKEKVDIEEQGKALLEEINEKMEALQERDEVLSSLKEELDALQSRENKMLSVKIDLEVKLTRSKNLLRDLRQEIPQYTRRIEGLKLQVVPDEPTEELKDLTEEELSNLDEETIARDLHKAKKKLPKEIPNMQIINEYKEKHEVYLKRQAEVDEITARRNKLKDVYDTATRNRNQEFLAGFNTIKSKLKEIYQMITLGGDADLELVDSFDPFSEGVVFSVRPPKKSWKNICNLSGGEKTVSSLALVFALHHYKPTPLYFMDEIDAALDFKNVSIIGNYIKQQTKNAQFIVISLRSNMFELADYLVGIYKTHNSTKSVTVDVGMWYDKAGIEPPAQQVSQMPNSQLQRYTNRNTQTQRLTQNLRHGLQASEQAQEPGTSRELCLPELGLCPTPSKNLPAQEDLSSKK